MHQKGFTIIELMISIFILVIGIIGVYSAFSTMVILTSDISLKFTASYLAQEGLELVRNMRDTNWILGRDWNYGLVVCENGCEADYKTAPGSLSPYGANYLSMDANGLYSYGLGDSTSFKRRINITLQEDSVLKVVVEILWDEKDQQYSFEAEEYLYDWY